MDIDLRDIGLVLLVIALALYIYGSTIWIGFCVIGAIVELFGWSGLLLSTDEDDT